MASYTVRPGCQIAKDGWHQHTVVYPLEGLPVVAPCQFCDAAFGAPAVTAPADDDEDLNRLGSDFQ